MASDAQSPTTQANDAGEGLISPPAERPRRDCGMGSAIGATCGNAYRGPVSTRIDEATAAFLGIGAAVAR